MSVLVHEQLKLHLERMHSNEKPWLLTEVSMEDSKTGKIWNTASAVKLHSLINCFYSYKKHNRI